MVCRVGPRGPGGERLPRGASIRRPRDIRAVLRKGRRTRTPSLDLHVLDGTGRRPRVGWIVPKLGYAAVARNRVRRRLRELARRQVLVELWRAGRGCDVLMRARRNAYRATYSGLAAEVTGGLEAIWSQD